jgi:hypothetical protein
VARGDRTQEVRDRQDNETYSFDDEQETTQAALVPPSRGDF